jgi:hypothetical protein
MSNVTLTIVQHRGESLALGRNVAVKLLLDKSDQKKSVEGAGIWSVARELWIRSSSRPRESYKKAA